MDTPEGNTALAVVRVSSKPLSMERDQTRIAMPKTKDWKDTLTGPCVDLDQTKLSPRINPKLNTNSLGRVSAWPLHFIRERRFHVVEFQHILFIIWLSVKRYTSIRASVLLSTKRTNLRIIPWGDSLLITPRGSVR